jgi:hypothetical protein
MSGHFYVSQSVVCETATVQECTLCVGWFFETKSVTQTQQNYRTQFNKQPPSDCAIRDWQRCFLETGSVHDRKRCGRPGVSDECVETISASFVRSPTKSTRRKPHVASSICLRATIFQKPRVDFVDTLYYWRSCEIEFDTSNKLSTCKIIIDGLV